MNTVLRWSNSVVDWLYIKFIIGPHVYYFLSELDPRTVVYGTEIWNGGGHAAFCSPLSVHLRQQHFSVGWKVQTLLLSLIIQLMYIHSFVILITMEHHISAHTWSLLFEVGGWSTCTAGRWYGVHKSTNGAWLQKYWMDGQVEGYKELGYSAYLVHLRMKY
jgi:hypothetical protein